METKIGVIFCTKEKIFDRFYSFLCYYTKGIYLKNYEKEDLIQEGYAAVIYAYNKYNKEINDNFSFYGRKSIMNKYFELIRKNAKNNYEVSLYTNNQHCQSIIQEKSLEYNLEEDAIGNITNTTLKSAILKLPKNERDLIIWVYYRDMTLTQYSKFKGIPYNICRKFNNQIKDKLKQYIANEKN